MKNIIYLLCILFISFCFLFLKKREIEDFEENKIPKIIWSYWDNPEIPKFISDCKKNWKKFANQLINYLKFSNKLILCLQFLIRKNISYNWQVLTGLPCFVTIKISCQHLNQLSGNWILTTAFVDVMNQNVNFKLCENTSL